jgi:sulfite exporter TauE/SafE
LGSYVHSHSAEAVAVSAPPQRNLTPWALFVVFVLGPCEPLIPILMYPAARLSMAGTLAVVVAFGAATLATMLTAVYLARSGLRRLSLGWAERYAHALAGASLGLCGLGMVFLDL